MRSIRRKLFWCFTLISVIFVVIVGTASYYISLNTLKEKIDIEMQNSTAQIGNSVKNRMIQIQKYMYLIFSNEEIQDIVMKTNFFQDAGMKYNDIKKLDKTFSYYFYMDKYLGAAAIFDEDGSTFVYQNNMKADVNSFRKDDWFKATNQSNGAVNWIGIQKNENLYDNMQYVFSVSQSMKDLKNVRPFDTIGVIYLSFSERMFYDLYASSDTDKEGFIMIIDKENRIISCRDKNKIMKDIKQEGFDIPSAQSIGKTYIKMLSGRKMMLFCYNIQPFGLSVVKAIPYNKVMGQAVSIGIVTVLICIICVLCIGMVSFFISKRISKPILALNVAMEKVQSGDFKATVMVDSRDEIGQMQSHFNYMVERIDTLFKDAIEAEIQKKKQELKVLQYQINPHFLSNTLNSIRIMAMLSKNDNIAEMIEALIRLLNNTIKKTGELVYVREELGNIKDYLYIHKIKSSGNIDAIFEVEDNILDLMMPVTLLQPIVENSIFHGIEPKKGAGTLKITGGIHNNKLIITIEDDGIGMTEEQIRNIYQSNAAINPNDHIGIRNVDARIKINFGTDFGILVESEPCTGTKVKVVLPLLYKKGEGL